MSRNELIDAYRRGRISRRTFVRGMTALGISGAAAARMADTMRAAPAPRGGRGTAAFQDDVYPTVAPTVAPPAPTRAPSQLPNTGAGGEDSGSSLWKPVAVAGAAAAAFAASRWRKIRGAESE